MRRVTLWWFVLLTVGLLVVGLLVAFIDFRSVQQLKAIQDVGGLVRKLGSNDPSVRVEASSALRDLARDGTVKSDFAPALLPLSRVLHGGSDSYAREQFAGALVAVAERAGIEPLIEKLNEDNQVVAADAADALGIIARGVHNPSLLHDAIRPLSRAVVRSDGALPSDWARIALVDLVSRVKERDALRPALKVLATGLNGEPHWVPINSAIALAAVADSAGDEPALQSATNRLLQLLTATATSEFAAKQAAAALRRIRHPGVKAALQGSSTPRLHDLRHDVVFGFPQAQAQVLCDQEDLRLSVWNNADYLYVQAIVWGDDDDSLGRTDEGREIGDTSQLSLDVDSDQDYTPRIDRHYALNSAPDHPGMHYEIVLGKGSSTGLLRDSKGRGAIRYVETKTGQRVRVDNFVIPLTEIGRRPGQQLNLAYWASSPKPKLTLNSIGYESGGPYYSIALPLQKYHMIMLSDRAASFSLSAVPEGRIDAIPTRK
jgi:hypothetical protein